MRRLTLAWLVLALAAFSPAGAAPALSSLIQPGQRLSALLPPSTVCQGLFIRPHRSEAQPFTSQTVVDKATGRVSGEFTSPVYQVKATLAADMSLISSEFVSHEDYTTGKLGHDRRTSARLAGEPDTLVVKYYLKGELKGEKELDYAFPTLDLDSVHLALQALLLQGVTSFEARTALKSKGLGGNVAVRLVETKDPLSLAPEYDYPPQLKKVLAARLGYKVYVIRLTGLFGLVFPHKYYGVFLAERPHAFVAYWGGQPRWAEYLVCGAQPAAPPAAP